VAKSSTGLRERTSPNASIISSLFRHLNIFLCFHGSCIAVNNVSETPYQYTQRFSALQPSQTRYRTCRAACVLYRPRAPMSRRMRGQREALSYIAKSRQPLDRFVKMSDESSLR
jgi:hypothetical protein